MTAVPTLSMTKCEAPFTPNSKTLNIRLSRGWFARIGHTSSSLTYPIHASRTVNMLQEKKRSNERPNKRKNSRKKAPPSQPNPSEAGPSTAASSSVQGSFTPSNIGARPEQTSLGGNCNTAHESNYVLSTPHDSRPRIYAPQALPCYPRTVRAPSVAMTSRAKTGLINVRFQDRRRGMVHSPPRLAAGTIPDGGVDSKGIMPGRFLDDSEGEDTDEPEPPTNTMVDRSERIGAGDHQTSPRPTSFSRPIPQRPYTAPPHHRDYIT
ncbi:hypothetical protein C7212DRAFT_366504 [Tuber magnatum]|uniref:Uncharacterized protein n=1 Tax=Tuber magnatum TaxID=42249 RepID=A0A317SDQ2_9PEZI|nr:hypothetical protein C7212DRAFT_366504 [Tuber magnatum]